MSDMPQGTGAAQKASDLASLERRRNELETEYDQILAKLKDIDSYSDQQGRHDARRYKLDEIRRDEISNQLRKIERQLSEAKESSSEWTNYAARKAADFVRGRLPRVDEDLKDAVRDEFSRQVKMAIDQGTFNRPDTQSEQAVEMILQDRFDYAIGRAYTQARAQGDDDDGEPDEGRKAPPREQGLDDKSGPPPEEKPDDPFGDDEDARRMFNDYIPRRQRKAKTLWEVQQEQRVAREKEREQREGKE